MIKFLRSFSTILGYLIGILMYAGSVMSGAEWYNRGLIFISIFVGIFLLFYSRLSNKIEESINLSNCYSWKIKQVYYTTLI